MECTWQADLKGVVNVFYTKMFNQQQEDWESILGEVRRIWKLPNQRKGNILNSVSPAGFYFLWHCFSQSCFIEASPCGISQRHVESPAAGWRLTLVTGRSPRGCRWQDQATGWCAVWYAPLVLGYYSKTQMIRPHIFKQYNPKLSWCGKKS